MPRVQRLLLVLAVIATGAAADDSGAIRDALAALQRGDFAGAERTLRGEVRARPSDGAALTLLGVALDNQKKFQEADGIHRRAAASAPNSPDVWNNYANHLLGTGDVTGAQKLYLRVVALDPGNFNANIQLTQLALKGQRGAEALGFLKHLPADRQDGAGLAPLRLAALCLAGEQAEADALAERLLASSRNDLRESFSIGVALANAGQFEKAESFFTQALTLAPADFNVQFNLGVVAWHTGHFQRAREVLDAARRQQPQNVDVLYTLASVEQAARKPEAAVALLAQAARLAPQRSDIQKLLALATGDLGALDDAAAAWDRYVKLEPNDDVGRRERGFTAFQMGRFEQGVRELRWFASRHPEDAVGHFELGAAEAKDDPTQAMAEFDRALQLQPDFAPAHSARGGLYYQMGKPEAALPDLEAAAEQRPDDAVSLDRLGQTYLALDRPRDAARVLRKAAALAPEDSKTQLHLARALADAGEAAESKAAMDRFRQLGPVVAKTVPGGLVDYLSLTPEQRRADYRRRVERWARTHADDAAAQVAYLRLLLEEGEAKEAVGTARRIADLKPAAAALADAGRALLEAGEYAAARDLLRQAAGSAPAAEVQLDLAVASFHASGAKEGARLLDEIPPAARDGEYFLARAEMLDAMGQAAESEATLEQALQSTPAKAELYLRACALLMRRGRAADALRASGDALRLFPQERQILLLRIAVLEKTGRHDEAGHLLEQAEARWPEWPAIWMARGSELAARGEGEEARRAFDTAVALGASGAEVKRYRDEIAAGKAFDPMQWIGR